MHWEDIPLGEVFVDKSGCQYIKFETDYAFNAVGNPITEGWILGAHNPAAFGPFDKAYVEFE